MNEKKSGVLVPLVMDNGVPRLPSAKSPRGSSGLERGLYPGSPPSVTLTISRQLGSSNLPELWSRQYISFGAMRTIAKTAGDQL